jgi:hypothetical protein
MNSDVIGVIIMAVINYTLAVVGLVVMFKIDNKKKRK